MRVTKQMHGYTLRLTDTEFDILRAMEASITIEYLRSILGTGGRRSYSRRCGIGSDKPLLRVDTDRRGDA